jgi:hypothetical protein
MIQDQPKDSQDQSYFPERGYIMANNFQIFVYRNTGSLHLKLIGDFDKNSVRKLLVALKKNCHGASKVYIHNNCLKKISSFGQNMSGGKPDILKSKSISIIFTGENTSKSVPAENYLFQSIWA